MVRWLVAFALFALALLARSVLGPLHGANPALSFYPVILVAALLLGWKEGLLILAVLIAVGFYFYLPPGMYLLPVGWLLVGGLTIGIITWLKSFAEQLAIANERQRILFRELQHRVANTLQSVAGMVEIASRRIGSAPSEAIRLLDEVAQRLSASAEVHRKLHDPALFQRGLDAILQDAVASVVGQGLVRVTFNIDDLDLTLDQMSTITMLVIEAANNAQKHVFQLGYGSQLSIALHALSDDRALLTVRDDGPGKTEIAHASTKPGLGMNIVEELVTQMRGTLKIRHAPGTEIAVEFPLGR